MKKAELLPRDKVLEDIRGNLLTFLEANRHVSMPIIAGQIGYSYDAVRHFHDGSRVTVPVALSLVSLYPELGEKYVCPHCRQLLIVAT